MTKAPLALACVLALGVGQAGAAQNCDTKQAESTPSSRFKDNGDGTVTDTKTKLVWRHCVVGMNWNGVSCEGQSQTYKFSAAKIQIEELNKARDGKRSDWRLPTREELSGLVEDRCFKPAINLDVFPYSPESGFWTADEDEGQVSSRAWIVHFTNGKQYVANVNQEWRIRPVAGK